MSTGRIFVAALIGAVVMFFWAFVEHTFLPTATMGYHSLPAEEVVVPVLKATLPKRGVYYFPPMNKNDTSEAAKKAFMEKMKTGPQGVIVFDPAGSDEMFFPKRLATEFIADLGAALLLAAILAKFGSSPVNGALLGTGFGLFAWLSIEVSYWNWYHTAGQYTIATLVEQGVGGLLSGLAIGIVLGRPRAVVVAP